MSIRLLIAMYFLSCGAVLHAEIPGTALSNDRDVLRLDVRGGLASPLPGINTGGAILWTFKPADAMGFATDMSMHVVDNNDTKLTTRSHDFVWEHSLPLFQGYHALRVRGGLGAVQVHRVLDSQLAREKGTTADRLTWAPHISGSVAIDFPIADIMWIRLGVWSEKAILKETPNQGGLFAGWAMGGQWLGIGD